VRFGCSCRARTPKEQNDRPNDSNRRRDDKSKPNHARSLNSLTEFARVRTHVDLCVACPPTHSKSARAKGRTPWEPYGVWRLVDCAVLQSKRCCAADKQHLKQRCEACAIPRTRILRRRPTDPKVDKAQSAIVVKQRVREADVTVSESLRMNLGDGVCEFCNGAARMFWRELGLGGEVHRQRSALNPLERDVADPRAGDADIEY
jgi:hypothetical protein